MGLFDLFDKEKREERARTRNIQRASSKYSQSADRLRALESLAADDSEEATYGLLRRFGMTYDKMIEDEQEKEWVFETLCEKGEAGLAALKRYLRQADSVAWPLRILERVANRDQEIEILKEVLERHPPGYERDPTKKIQIMHHLASVKHPEAPALARPYLADMDEGVRFAAVEALLQQKNPEIAREAILELFCSDEEDSLRIRIKIAQGLADLSWPVHGHRGTAEKKLPDGFQIDREGRFKKTQPKA